MSLRLTPTALRGVTKPLDWRNTNLGSNLVRADRFRKGWFLALSRITPVTGRIELADEFKESFSYETRFVGFVDILGFSAMIKDPVKSDRYAASLYRVINSIVNNEGVSEIGKHIDTGEEIEFEFMSSAYSTGRVTSLSDAVILSVPETRLEHSAKQGGKSAQILACLEAISDLQAALISLGILTRGGLSFGKFFHGTDVAIGEGLVDAYRIESQLAVVPRVVVDPKIIETLIIEPFPEIIGFRSRVANRLSIDSDGHWYVNYLGYKFAGGGMMNQERSLVEVLETIKRRLKNSTNDRIRKKLSWIESYVTESIKSYLPENYKKYLMHNQGTKFHARYPRSFENLGHMVENYKLNGEYIDPLGDG